MSFLFGEIKPKKEEPKRLTPAKEQKQLPQVAESRLEKQVPVKKEEIVKTGEIKDKKAEEKPAPKRAETPKVPVRRTVSKPQTADERLRESFLRRLRSLGGDYFEYYSVYLLERYSMKNGRRLEGLRISGGEHDGGIDGEIELTDKLGFKETIYIQSKNWNPEKCDEKLWVVGETLLQQFIGACACRQAKEGKQNCRGIFITTSRFTPEAKRILDTMSDKIVGYDGNDLYDAAKECAFGLVEKNGVWALDEKLLSGSKAFFQLY
jgi:restriction system protein